MSYIVGIVVQAGYVNPALVTLMHCLSLIQDAAMLINTRQVNASSPPGYGSGSGRCSLRHGRVGVRPNMLNGRHLDRRSGSCCK